MCLKPFTALPYLADGFVDVVALAGIRVGLIFPNASSLTRRVTIANARASFLYFAWQNHSAQQKLKLKFGGRPRMLAAPA